MVLVFAARKMKIAVDKFAALGALAAIKRVHSAVDRKLRITIYLEQVHYCI